MAHRWDLRCPAPTGLFEPVPVGAVDGPTRAQARSSRWRRSSPRRYVPASVALTVEQRILEAAQRLVGGGAVSGWASLRLAGANLSDGLGPDGTSVLPVPLVVPTTANLRPGPGSVRHRMLLPASEVVERHGVPCTVVPRAVLDGVRWASDEREGVVIVDVALAAGLTSISRLTAYAGRLGRAPGVTRFRRALSLANDRSRSPNETRMRLIWRLDGGFPEPRCNWPIADLDGRRIGRPDLLVDALAVVGEFDGADHRGARVRSTDFGKESDYRDVGLEVFRVTGSDLANRTLVLGRMRAAVRRAAESGRPRAWMVGVDPGPL